VYDLRRFGLRVQGILPRLADFVSRMEWTALEGFKISSVNIAENEARHVLTLDIALHTSPYSTAEREGPPPIASRPAMPVDRELPPPGLAQLDEALAAARASGEWRQAVDLIAQIRALDPDHDEAAEKPCVAYVNYGREPLERGDASGATAQLSAALKVKPDGEEVVRELQQAAAAPSRP
jgi:hypothetical protein